MANTIESVKQLVRKAVERATGWTSIFGPTQGVEPANQYCLVTLMGQESQQHDVIFWRETDENLIENQRDECTLQFEIQARGEGAMSAIDRVVSYFDSSIRDMDLWPYVGSGGHDNAQSLSTELHQGKILEVGVVNIYIHTTLPKQNILEYFNVIDITTKTYDNVIVSEITIPEN